MNIYEVVTTWERYSLIAESFEEAYLKAVRNNEEEREAALDEGIADSELPEISSILFHGKIRE